jgi:dTDP-4-dehydrorhamnose reductase
MDYLKLSIGTRIILTGGRTLNIKKIVIFGGKGQLGKSLFFKLKDLNYEVIALGKDELDIKNEGAIFSLLSQIRPQFLVNCAGWTDVNEAENFPVEANLVNAISMIGITKACVSFGVKLIHISTDYVFSGESNSSYRVDSERIPVNKYGETKLGGELIIESSDKLEYWILRSSWLYGNSKNDIISKLLSKYWSNNNPIPVVKDQFGHPTYVFDLAKRITEVINLEPKYGVYHASNTGTTSWYNFAQQAFQILGLEYNRVTPVDYVELNLNVNRPSRVTLDFSKWESVGLTPMRNWSLALNDCLKRGKLYNENYTT